MARTGFCNTAHHANTTNQTIEVNVPVDAVLAAVLDLILVLALVLAPCKKVKKVWSAR